MTSLKEHRNIEKAAKKKGQHFTSIPPDEIEKVLKRANTPILSGFTTGFNPVKPGQTIRTAFDVYNPGPDGAGNLSVHVWVGFQIVDANGGTCCWISISGFPASRSRSGRVNGWDALSSELFGPFSLAIPTQVEKTIYVLNACLVQWTYDPRGGYFEFLNHLGLNIIEVIA